ncbi:uncharacterized protein EDB91DRAFT_517857 [Suillus paluster]|uniref:uncharacterized protein n=1 Tax=Suillus paluster TaxID=48578 RepID=UPI001B85BD0C|nr:uncharacterized protein EDB91DRAFT_517857 [Suillus paluster]KAG1752459.1 hypothetical protein EDB91DRAFT_517857 [Suillus paluster]
MRNAVFTVLAYMWFDGVTTLSRHHPRPYPCDHLCIGYVCDAGLLIWCGGTCRFLYMNPTLLGCAPVAPSSPRSVTHVMAQWNLAFILLVLLQISRAS